MASVPFGNPRPLDDPLCLILERGVTSAGRIELGDYFLGLKSAAELLPAEFLNGIDQAKAIPIAMSLDD